MPDAACQPRLRLLAREARAHGADATDYTARATARQALKVFPALRCLEVASGVASNLFNNFALGPVVYAVAMGYFASSTPLERTTRALARRREGGVERRVLRSGQGGGVVGSG